MDKVIKNCLELGTDNPIESIHDQGAGGNGNVLKEKLKNMWPRVVASTWVLTACFLLISAILLITQM